MRPSTRLSPIRATRHEVRPGIWVDSRLAVWFAAERLLAVADLHWGYAAAHRARGNLLPVWGDDEIEARLLALCADYRPAEMLWLGDVVHAAEGASRAEHFLTHAPVPITLVAGNHDRRWRQAGAMEVVRGALHFHHGDRVLAAPEGTTLQVCGHHHPAALCSDGAGTRLKLPALVAGPARWILPAFSPWAAGTPWNDQLAAGDTLWVLAPTRIFALPRVSRGASSLIA